MSAAVSDYTSITMDVTFVPGSTMATVRVPIIDDTELEEDEMFTAFLSSSDSNVMVGDDTATVNILDNDGGKSSSSYCFCGLSLQISRIFFFSYC